MHARCLEIPADHLRAQLVEKMLAEDEKAVSTCTAVERLGQYDRALRSKNHCSHDVLLN